LERTGLSIFDIKGNSNFEIVIAEGIIKNNPKKRNQKECLELLLLEMQHFFYVKKEKVLS